MHLYISPDYASTLCCRLEPWTRRRPSPPSHRSFFLYPLTLKPLDPHPPPPPWQTEASDEEKTLTSVASEGDASALETTAAEMAAAAAALVSVERDLIAMQANGADGAGLAAKQVRSGFVCFCSLVGGSNWVSKICF